MPCTHFDAIYLSMQQMARGYLKKTSNTEHAVRSSASDGDRANSWVKTVLKSLIDRNLIYEWFSSHLSRSGSSSSSSSYSAGNGATTRNCSTPDIGCLNAFIHNILVSIDVVTGVP